MAGLRPNNRIALYCACVLLAALFGLPGVALCLDEITVSTLSTEVNAGQSSSTSEKTIASKTFTITSTGSIIYTGTTIPSTGAINAEGDNTIILQSGASITATGNQSSGTSGINLTYGFTQYSSVTGVSGSAVNTVIINSGASITTNGDKTKGIITKDNNSITMNGTLTTNGANATCIDAEYNNTINIGGTVTAKGGANVITAQENNLITVSESGLLTMDGNSSGYSAILTNSNNIVVLAGTITSSQSSSNGLYLSLSGNAAYISGTINLTGSSSYALRSGYTYGTTTIGNTFHILSGASITGGILNADTNNNSTSYLTFGYTKNASNQSDLTSVDNDFSFTYSGNITSSSSGNWDGYFAGGSTTLNGTTNSFRNIFVGASCFTVATVPNGVGNGGMDTISAVSGATATLTIGNAISTTGTVTVGSGSTYNLYGTHTHTGGTVAIDGTLNLNGGTFVNNATSGTQTIGTLNVASGQTGTLSGSAATTVTAANITGTLSSAGSADVTLTTATLDGGTFSNTATGGTQTISTLNVSSGQTGTLAGTTATAVTTANLNGTLNYTASTGTTISAANIAGTIDNQSASALVLTTATISDNSTATLSNSSTGSMTITSLVLGSGDETLITIGDVTITNPISFAASAGADTLNVKSGTLTTSSALTFGDSDILMGSGTLVCASGVQFTGTDGYIKPGNSIGTLTITGDLAINSNTTLEIECEGTTSDKLLVSGTTTIASTATLTVSAVATGYLPSGTSYTILTSTGGLTNNGTISILGSSNTAVYTFSVSSDANNIYLDVVTRTDYTTIASTGTSNVKEVVKPLALVESTATGDLRTVMNALDSLPTSSSFHKALSMMSPEESVVPVIEAGQAVASAFSRTIASRASFVNRISAFSEAGLSLEGPVGPAGPYASLGGQPTEHLYGCWLKPFGTWADQDTVNNHAGFDYNTYGIALGGDRKIGDRLVIGLAGGYANTNTQSDGIQNAQAEINSWCMGTYTTYTISQNVIDLNYNYIINNNEGHRDIAFGEISRRASSDFNSHEHLISTNYGHNFRFSNLMVTPQAGMNFGWYNQDSYKETGADSINLRVDQYKFASVQGKLGICLGYIITDRISTDLSAHWGYEFNNTEQEVSASFEGVPNASFTVDGAEQDRESFQFGIGVKGKINGFTAAYVNYDLELRDSYRAHNLATGISFEF